ncbi:MAG TPA: Gfo/Idh/MocA family oxidoreductase [Anaeromyxobacter sp.]|nr:Gfo/Idh/MocA family oxidoreductase [Anaeromyxobacter sp.]
MDQLRVGFIGAGRISDLHAIEYLRNPRSRIVAVCDANLDIARHQAERWGVPRARVFQSWDELLRLDEVDLVEILTPHHLHKPAALAAFAARKHVSLQKPMALSLAEAEEINSAAERAGVFFKVFENFVFYPPIVKAKELIEAGAIGEPITIRVKSNAGKGKHAWPVPPAAQAWRMDPATCGGGPLAFDDGHHKFALGWFFMGQAEEVHAWIGRTESSRGEILDSPAIVSWKFANGRMGNLEVVYSRDLEIDTVHYAQDDRVEITGTRGVIWVNRGHGRLFDQPPVVLYADDEVRSFSGMEAGWEASFIASTRHHIEALLEGRPPFLTGRQGAEILRFALAAQESVRLGRAVRVSP